MEQDKNLVSIKIKRNGDNVGYGLLYKPQQLIFTQSITIELAKQLGWTYEELTEKEDKEI